MFWNGNSANLLERGVLNLDQFGEFWKFLFQFGKVCVGEERVEGARQRRGCQGPSGNRGKDGSNPPTANNGNSGPSGADGKDGTDGIPGQSGSVVI